MRLSVLFRSVGVALLGLLFGVILTFELIRFDIIPGGKALMGKNFGGDASVRQHGVDRVRDHHAEDQMSEAPPPPNPVQREIALPVKSGVVVRKGYSSTSTAGYPEAYGLNDFNKKVAPVIGPQSSRQVPQQKQTKLRGSGNSNGNEGDRSLSNDGGLHAGVQRQISSGGGNEGWS